MWSWTNIKEPNCRVVTRKSDVCHFAKSAYFTIILINSENRKEAFFSCAAIIQKNLAFLPIFGFCQGNSAINLPPIKSAWMICGTDPNVYALFRNSHYVSPKNEKAQKISKNSLRLRVFAREFTFSSTTYRRGVFRRLSRFGGFCPLRVSRRNCGDRWRFRPSIRGRIGRIGFRPAPVSFRAWFRA